MINRLMIIREIIHYLMVLLVLLALAWHVTAWMNQPLINQRIVKTVTVGPNMCAGFKTVSLMR